VQAYNASASPYRSIETEIERERGAVTKRGIGGNGEVEFGLGLYR